MNSYNDNLHSDVVDSLANQQAELKTTKANLTASTFSLFYAEGAKITAEQKLEEDALVYAFEAVVTTQAILNNNLAVNLNGTAQDQKAHTALSSTNTATGAANVQIASNAILRLASNVGSIYSIASAANYDSEIYLQSVEAYRLMGITAYEAERTSQVAMEASALTAKVSSSTVSDMATNTQKSVANILNVVVNDFNTSGTTLATDNVNLASANAAEKVAEGVVEYNNTDYRAAKSAFMLSNKELNLNLHGRQNKEDKNLFEVTFDFYKSPFMRDGNEKEGGIRLGEEIGSTASGYPVRAYYVMVVKDSNKSVFSIANAEALLLNANQYYKINAAPLLGQQNIKASIPISDLNDSDGDPIQFGTKYVVYVLTVFVEEYKKNINNFDDYLTAPSNTFTLKNKLVRPASSSIRINKTTKNELDFDIVEDPEYPVQYRCYLLPDNALLLQGLLTAQRVMNLEEEVEKREQIADMYVPKITKLSSEIVSSQSQLGALKDAQQEILSAIHKTKDKEVLNRLNEENKANQKKQKDISDALKAAEKNLAALEAEQQKAVSRLLYTPISRPGFFFDINVAEQIPAGNYTIAKLLPHPTPKTSVKDKVTQVQLPKVWSVSFSADTNDVFGNKIESGASYVPAILSLSTAVVEDRSQFANSLSDFANTTPMPINI